MGEILEGFIKAKDWYKSKTIWGIVIALLSTVLKMFWPEVDLQEGVNEVWESGEQLAQEADNIWLTITQFAGLAYAAYGRIVAKAGIKLPTK